VNVHNDVESLKGALYGEAAKYWRWSLWVNGLTVLFFLAGAITEWGFIIWISGLLAFISPGIVVFCRELYLSHFRQADKLRRLVHYADSLGEKIACTDMACISTFKLNIKYVAPSHLEPYYFSKASPGKERLLENSREAAFFTFSLSNVMKWYFLIAVIIISTVACVILYLAASGTIPPNKFQVFAKSATILVSFIFAGDIFVIFMRYMAVSKEAKDAYKCFTQMLLRSSSTQAEAMQSFEDYNISLILGPPILLGVYLKYKDTLNERYRKLHG
jgi:hypothetical protein